MPSYLDDEREIVSRGVVFVLLIDLCRAVSWKEQMFRPKRYSWLESFESRGTERRGVPLTKTLGT